MFTYIRGAAGKRYERGLSCFAAHGVPGVLLPSQPLDTERKNNSYQRCSGGGLDHNGCGNLIIDTVAAVLDHHDAHFAFTGNNRDFLATVAP